VAAADLGRTTAEVVGKYQLVLADSHAAAVKHTVIRTEKTMGVVIILAKPKRVSGRK
jgi:hypothetical protein